MNLRTRRLIEHARTAAHQDSGSPFKWRYVIVAASYLLAGLFITARLWRDLAHRRVEINSDQSQFIWFLRHAQRVVTEGVDPFFTHLLNVPDGVNLMANTGALALTIPMVPVTMLFGAEVSFLVLLVLGLAGTAFGWYLVFSKLLTKSPLAAAIGGAFCGFAPGMISHANGHINWTAQFLVPFLVLAALKLSSGKSGVVLGVLVVIQAFINEEVLLYTALALAVFLGAYGWLEKRPVKPILKPLGIAAAIAAVALAYPLYRQFFGGQTYHGLPSSVANYRADLASYPAFSRLSFGGLPGPNRLSWNISEENTFFGWPLLILMAVVMIWLWHRTLIKALAMTAGVFFILSLGTTLMVGRRGTGIPLPWLVLQKLPLMGHVITVRFGLVLVPVIGALLVVCVDLVRRIEKTQQRRLAWLALIIAILPILPVPIPAKHHPGTPAFITSGAWKEWIPSGRTLVAVPVTSEEFPQAMEWQRAKSDFALAGGYFLGPDESGRARFGAVPRPTAALIREVYTTGKVPEITPEMRTAFKHDVSFWRAAAIVLPDYQEYRGEELARLLTGLAGPGWHTSDVTLWDVRD